ncbi:MAG TPA: DUF177 domain-containing protein [Balneolales bacterium]|nr:DUF177 domain-containing protein [Balneolales bacterium]
MIEFKLNEIPDGKSTQELELVSDQLDLGEKYKFDGGRLTVHFDKSFDTIRVSFNIKTVLSLICDRSLEPFDYQIDRNYRIIFEDDADVTSYEEEDTAVRPLNIHENKIRIDKEVRDTILLSIPIKKLHPKFLDENGNPTDFQKTYGDEEFTDPRWDALKSLKNN